MEQATINLLQYGAIGATCVILFGLVFYLIKVLIKINDDNNATYKEVGEKLDKMGDKISMSIERALIESNRK